MSLIILFPHVSSYELLWFENRFLQCMLAVAAWLHKVYNYKVVYAYHSWASGSWDNDEFIVDIILYLGWNYANHPCNNTADVTLQHLQIEALNALQHIALESLLWPADHVNEYLMWKVQTHLQLLHTALQHQIDFPKLLFSRKAATAFLRVLILTDLVLHQLLWIDLLQTKSCTIRRRLQSLNRRTQWIPGRSAWSQNWASMMRCWRCFYSSSASSSCHLDASLLENPNSMMQILHVVGRIANNSGPVTLSRIRRNSSLVGDLHTDLFLEYSFYKQTNIEPQSVGLINRFARDALKSLKITPTSSRLKPARRLERGYAIAQCSVASRSSKSLEKRSWETDRRPTLELGGKKDSKTANLLLISSRRCRSLRMWSACSKVTLGFAPAPCGKLHPWFFSAFLIRCCTLLGSVNLSLTLFDTAGEGTLSPPHRYTPTFALYCELLSINAAAGVLSSYEDFPSTETISSCRVVGNGAICCRHAGWGEGKLAPSCTEKAGTSSGNDGENTSNCCPLGSTSAATETEGTTATAEGDAPATLGEEVYDINGSPAWAFAHCQQLDAESDQR